MSHGEFNNKGMRSAVVALLISITLHIWVLVIAVPARLGEPSNPLMAAQASLPHEFLRVALSTSEQSSERVPTIFTHDIDYGILETDVDQPPPPKKNITAGKKTIYFFNSEVDIPAEPISRPSIIYPEQAMLSKLGGKVRVRILIDSEGRVNSLELLESQPPYPLFEEIALSALKETLFNPAKRFGLAVNSQKIVEVMFNPYEDSASNP